MANLNVIVNNMLPTTASSYAYFTTGISNLKPNTTYTVYLCAKCSQALRDANRYFVHYVYGSKTTGEWEWQHPTYCYSTEPTVVRSTFTTSSNTSAINGVGCYNFPALSSAPEEQNSTCYWYKVIEGDVDASDWRFGLSTVEYYYTAPGDNAKYTTTPLNTNFINWDFWYSDNTNRTSMSTAEFGYPVFIISHPVGVYGGIYAQGSQFVNKNITVSLDCYCNIPFQWGRFAETGAVVTKEDLVYSETDVGTWKRVYYSGYNQGNIIFFPTGHASVPVNIFFKNIKIVVDKLYLDTPGYTINPIDYSYSELVNEPTAQQLTQIRPPEDCTDFLIAQNHIRHLRFFNGNNVLASSFGYVGTSLPSGWVDNGGSISRTTDTKQTYMGFPSIETTLGKGIIYSGWIPVTPGKIYTTMCLMYTETEVNPTKADNKPIHAWGSLDQISWNANLINYLESDQYWPGGQWKWGYTTFTPADRCQYYKPIIYYNDNTGSNAVTAYIQAILIVPGPVTAHKDLAAWIGYRYPIATLSNHSSGTQLRYLYSDGALDPWITIDSGGATGNSLLTTSYSNWEYNDITRSRSIMAFFDDGGLDIDSQEELAETEIEYGDWKYEGGNISRTREVTIKYTYPDEIKVEHTSETEYGEIQYGDWKYDNINRTRSISYIYYDITKSGGWSTETADLKELVASTTYVDKHRTNLVKNGPTWIDSNGDRKTVIITGNYIFYDDTHVNRDLTNVCEYIYITKDTIKAVCQTTEIQFNISDLSK